MGKSNSVFTRGDVGIVEPLKPCRTKVKGGVPSEGDVIAAIDDLELLYHACSETGKLADSTFDFMKQPLKVDDVNQIAAKVAYQPPPVQVLGYDQFPTASA